MYFLLLHRAWPVVVQVPDAPPLRGHDVQATHLEMHNHNCGWQTSPSRRCTSWPSSADGKLLAIASRTVYVKSSIKRQPRTSLFSALGLWGIHSDLLSKVIVFAAEVFRCIPLRCMEHCW